MTRTIMVIPVDKNIGLTTISLSLIKLFEQENKKVLFFKPCFQCFNNNIQLDNTSYILKKYFSTSYVQCYHKKKNNIFFSKLKEQYFIENNINLYLLNKKFYDIILIEGIESFYQENDINELNFCLANHLNSEIIFICSNNDSNIKLYDQRKNIFNKYLNIKGNILGAIINSIILYHKNIYVYDFLQPTIYKKKYKTLINSSFFFPVIGHIKWNEELIILPIDKIFRYLQIGEIIKNNFDIYSIKFFVLYHDFIFNQKKYFYNSILIIPFNVFLKKYKEKSFKIWHYFNFHGILLTNYNSLDILKKNFFIKLCHKKTSIFSTILDIRTVLYILKKININIIEQNKSQINKLKNYIYKSINKNLIFNNNTSKAKKNFKVISPILFCNSLKEKAKKIYKCILLPEGYSPKIIQAASIATDLEIAKCILLGNPEKIYEISLLNKIKISKKLEIINPENIYSNYILQLFSLRSKNGMTYHEAELSLQNNNMMLGALMLRNDKVDGVVCGIQYTSADVLRSAFQIIGTKNNNNFHSCNKIVSSIFFMLLQDRILVYGDCAININPNEEQLSEIAIQSADLAKKFGIIPRIAMLSYSTGNSGSGETVNKVKQATILVKRKRPDLIIDGPIQYDASVNISISNIKNPFSPLLGKSTVFIFPDLNSGNITYKAVQQSSNILSIGPILQGLDKPINDLSRGSSIDDIIYTIAITAIQSNITKI